MKFPDWLRTTWWALLVLGMIVLLAFRLQAFRSGTAVPVDAVAFIIFMALLLAPLFSEVSLWGLSLKKEIQELQDEVKTATASLRNDIRNTIDNRTNFSPSIHFPSPVPDRQLPALEEQIKSALEEVLREHQLRPTQPLPDPVAVPDSAVLLFQARYSVERELRRVFQDRLVADVPRRNTPVWRLAETLVEEGVIDKRIAMAIRELYAVASPAIHGEEATEAQIAFVRDVTPELVATLRAIR